MRRPIIAAFIFMLSVCGGSGVYAHDRSHCRLEQKLPSLVAKEQDLFANRERAGDRLTQYVNSVDEAVQAIVNKPNSAEFERAAKAYGRAGQRFLGSMMSYNESVDELLQMLAELLDCLR